MAEQTIPVSTEKHTPTSREEIRDSGQYLSPPVDIYETTQGLVVVADLPGVERDALKVNVEDNVLTIEGRTKHTAPGTPVWTEYRLLDFFRQFELPEEVDQEKIKAELKHGVLTIQLPKSERAKPKQVTVNIG